MAYSEEGYERNVIAPRLAVRRRMADHLDWRAQQAGSTLAFADGAGLEHPHHFRRLAERLRIE